MMESQSEFSNVLNVDSLGETAIRIHLDADEAACSALAERFDLASVESLFGDLIVERIKGDGLIRVSGRMRASITQRCVVTGGFVPAEIGENVDERFGLPRGTEVEVEIAIDEEDPPEPIIESGIDLGEIISQYLGVAIEPYPKAPGAEIPQRYQAEKDDVLDTPKNPFEILTTLKRDGE